MEEIRKAHNLFKREIIQAVCQGDGLQVLDVGCGYGGDLQKWKHVGAHVSMCDPSADALEEARTRAKGLKMHVSFYLGDVSACPNRKYDVLCYNFSLHYIFASSDLFYRSIKEIRKRMKPGGTLAGIIPDSEAIIMRTPMQDDLGNFFLMKGTPEGGFGEKLFVNLADTPYYEDGAKSEPMAYKDRLVTTLEQHGFHLVYWGPLTGHRVSQMYSKFIFAYRNAGRGGRTHHREPVRASEHT
jgi:SAM-dependent methyltransferase